MKNLYFLVLLFLPSMLLAEKPSIDPDPFSEKIFCDPAGKSYFPKDRTGWYTKQLSVMKEPSIYSLKGSENTDQFRFLHVPTFSKPMAFRAFREKGGYFIQATRLTGAGGYDSGGIEFTAKVRVSQEDWNSIRSAILEHYKNKPITQDHENLLGGLDGSRWILESFIDGEYKVQNIFGAEGWLTKESTELLNQELGDQSPPLISSLISFVHSCKLFLNYSDLVLSKRVVNYKN